MKHIWYGEIHTHIVAAAHCQSFSQRNTLTCIVLRPRRNVLITRRIHPHLDLLQPETRYDYTWSTWVLCCVNIYVGCLVLSMRLDVIWSGSWPAITFVAFLPHAMLEWFSSELEVTSAVFVRNTSCSHASQSFCQYLLSDSSVTCKLIGYKVFNASPQSYVEHTDSSTHQQLMVIIS